MALVPTIRHLAILLLYREMRFSVHFTTLFSIFRVAVFISKNTAKKLTDCFCWSSTSAVRFEPINGRGLLIWRFSIADDRPFPFELAPFLARFEQLAEELQAAPSPATTSPLLVEAVEDAFDWNFDNYYLY